MMCVELRLISEHRPESGHAMPPMVTKTELLVVPK